ncbi:unnamed protein product, partial [Rotaria socialis]
MLHCNSVSHNFFSRKVYHQLISTLGIGSAHARTGDILAFIVNWANTFILLPSSTAILALTFGTYFLSGVTNSPSPPIRFIKMLAIFVIGLLIDSLLFLFLFYTKMHDDLGILGTTWGEAVLGPAVRVLTILVSFSALGSANAKIYTSGRYFMVGARYGYLPEMFSCIQKQRLTPLPSIVLMTILSIIYCIPSNIGNLIGFVSFVSWMFFGLTFLATIFCKFTKAKADRVIKVPIPVIIFMILVSIYLVIAPVISSPNIGYLVALIILLVGL